MTRKQVDPMIKMALTRRRALHSRAIALSKRVVFLVEDGLKNNPDSSLDEFKSKISELKTLVNGIVILDQVCGGELVIDEKTQKRLGKEVTDVLQRFVNRHRDVSQMWFTVRNPGMFSSSNLLHEMMSGLNHGKHNALVTPFQEFQKKVELIKRIEEARRLLGLI